MIMLLVLLVALSGCAMPLAQQQDIHFTKKLDNINLYYSQRFRHITDIDQIIPFLNNNVRYDQSAVKYRYTFDEVL